MEDTLTHEGIYSNTSLPMQLPYLLSDKDTLKNNHIAYINPFRYRSYYYDTETNLYYLTTRYYDPETGRFINADDISIIDTTKDYIGGLNLYAYCLNNPINTADDDGTMPNWLKWLVGGIVIVGLVIATVATGGAAGGVAGFILAGALKGAIIGAVSSALIGGTIGGISSYFAGNEFWSGFANGAADGFLSGAIIGGVTGAIGNAVKVGQAAKLWDKGTFKYRFQSMRKHYAKHVVSEGFNHGNNIVKYTNDAINFANRNSGSLKFLLSANPNNANWAAGWTLKAQTGINGWFTSRGKILNFWYSSKIDNIIWLAFISIL